jgi:DNA-binding CsgD family transcriptional regulator/tetratricopeptide (TPR) repeat protein
MLTRVAALSEGAQRILGIAAVEPGLIDPVRIAAVAGLPEIEVEGPVHEALAAQVIVPDPAGAVDGYRFRHALLAEAVLDELLPSERRRLHASYAAFLAERSVPPGAEGASQLALLAYHATGARQSAMALGAWVRAARAARAAYGSPEALEAYDNALALWDAVPLEQLPEGVDVADLYREASSIALTAGRPERAVELAREAVAAVDLAVEPRRWALAAEALGRAYWIAGEPVEGIRELEQAASVLAGSPPSGEYARVLATLAGARMLRGDNAEAIPLARAAMAMAREVDDPIAEANALITMGTSQANLGGCDEGLATLRSGLELTRELDAVDLLQRAYANLSSALSLCGDGEEAYQVAIEGAMRSKELGAWSQYGRFIAAGAVDAAVELGRWDDAEELLDEICETELTGVLRLAIPATGATSWARRGRTGQAAIVAEAWALVVRRHETPFTGWIIAGLVEQALTDGRPEEAARIAADALQKFGITDDVVFFDTAWVAARAEADLAEVLRARRDSGGAGEAAARSARLAAEVRSRSQGESGTGSGRRVASHIAITRAEAARAAGRGDVVAWRSAVVTMDAVPLAWPSAYAQYRLGEALLATHADRATVVEVLTDARDRTKRLGAAPLLADIEGLARRARIPLPGPADVVAAAIDADAPTTDDDKAPDDFGLTTRERDVLRLVAAGYTNRRIGETLFISESTAGVHVSNILAKLGVTTRTEAAAVAARVGLDT